MHVPTDWLLPFLQSGGSSSEDIHLLRASPGHSHMPWYASAFQVVLRVVRQWWLKGFSDLRVRGQLALEDDDDDRGGRTMQQYVIEYMAKSMHHFRVALTFRGTTWDQLSSRQPSASHALWSAAGICVSSFMPKSAHRLQGLMACHLYGEKVLLSSNLHTQMLAMREDSEHEHTESHIP